MAVHGCMCGLVVCLLLFFPFYLCGNHKFILPYFKNYLGCFNLCTWQKQSVATVGKDQEQGNEWSPPLSGMEPDAPTLENCVIVPSKVEHMCAYSWHFQLYVLGKLLNICTKNINRGIVAIFKKNWNNPNHSLIVEWSNNSNYI